MDNQGTERGFYATVHIYIEDELVATIPPTLNLQNLDGTSGLDFTPTMEPPDIT